MIEQTTGSKQSPQERRSLGRRVIGWLGTVVVFVAALHIAGKIRAPDLPDRVHDATFRTLDGQLFALSSLRGRTVVLNFWATWCTPCRLEMPVFRRYAENHPDVMIIGVTADGSVADIERAVEELDITWPVTTPDRSLNQRFDISSYPTTVVIDEMGRTKATHAGLLTDPQLLWLMW